jgi:uncharacterized membrane protein YfhO
VAERARAVDGQADALARMRAADFSPTTEVVVEGGDELASRASGSATVQVVAYEPERVEVVVRVEAPGYLVLSDAHYPGWRAWVDGQETAVLTADLLFRAVRLEPGWHRVVFAFEPRIVRIGMAISAVGMAALVGLLGVCVYNRKRRVGE